MRQKTFQTRYIWCVLLALTCLLTACSGGGSSSEELDPPAPTPTPNPTPENQEIKLNANVWNMMEGMRATTYDNQAAIQAEGSFTCTVYQANSTTAYISPTAVDWNSTSSQWGWSDGKHYWPISGSFDFFAYMPATPPSYITGPTYAVSGEPAAPHPYFTCDMGKTVDKEFIYALATGQSRAGQGASGVTLTFQHPFARIYFKLSEASGTHVTINSITISGDDFYMTGKCTLASSSTTWSEKGNYGSLGTLGIDTPYLVIPNNYGSSKTITVNATWDEWTSFTTSVTSSALSINWEAGYSYTYTLTLSKYALNVDTSKFTEQW